MQSKAFKILLPFGLLVIAVVIAAVMMLTRPQAEKRTPPVPRPRVTVTVVDEAQAGVAIRGYGSVKAKRSVTLVPQVSGEVLLKHDDFEPGGYFAEGQLLLKIDDTDYQLALAQAQANLAAAEMELAMAEEEAESARLEWEEIGTPGEEPSPLVLREPHLKLAQAGLESARAAVRQAKVNLERCTVTAPFAGRVLDASADVGQYLRAGTGIGTIYATDIAEISIPVPDEDLAWLQTGAEGGAEVEISAEFAGARHTWLGRAVRLGGAVDARSRLVPVVVEVDNPYQQVGDRPPLVEGMFVDAVFRSSLEDDSLVIPRSALRPGNVVWAVNSDSEVEVLPVLVARAGVDQAIITSGVAPGMRLITSNLQFATPGMMVQIEGENAKGGER
jgi:RND family efflux transporter MFP subunit